MTTTRSGTWTVSVLCAALMLLARPGRPAAEDPSTPLAADKVLFDFEDDADVKAWAPLEPPALERHEPAPRLELSTEGASTVIMIG